MKYAYVNGHYVNEKVATISIFDRGFLFADAVYEVTTVVDGKLLEFEGHMARLKRSLDKLSIADPLDKEEFLNLHRGLVTRNKLQEGVVYLQISRGSAQRDFLYPPSTTTPTVVAFTQKKTLLRKQLPLVGRRIITVEDLRWGRCDIKTVQLLYPSMIKNKAQALGAEDAWMIKEGFITEGLSSNAFIVTHDRTIVTRNLTNRILGGITRNAVLDCARQLNLRIEERPFSVAEAEAATEAFSTSAPTFVNPIIRINDRQIGDGQPGKVTTQLSEIYVRNSRRFAV